MSADGTWNITMDAPMGSQSATLTILTSGGAATGTYAGELGTTEITNGHVDGNHLTWQADIVVPMPMTLDFDGTVDGDKISGQVTAGTFGSSPFSGVRV